MRVIIIGAGKVGFSIAQMLSYENHDVVVIEKKQMRHKIIDENLDVKTIHGSGASAAVLEEAGIYEADLLISVTEFDELNMVSCILAKKYGVKKTVARVRNTEYFINTKMNLSKSLGIDLIINPERVTAEVISKLIQVPEAINVEYYADGKVQLLEVVIKEDSPVINKRLIEIDFPKPNLIVAILRDEKMIIPRGTDYIRPGDLVFIIAETKNMLAVEKVLGKKRTKMEHVVILGGGRIGYHLAKILEKKPVTVKVIDSDIEVCREISSELEDTLVLNGDGTDLSLLEEEDVANTDMFVSVTNDDKVNLLVSLLAKHIGAKKTAAQVRRSDYISLIEKVGVDVAVSPRMLTAGAILQFIRRGDIVSVTLLGSAKAEMLELMVPNNKRIINKSLKSLKFPKDAIIGAIVRDNSVIVPTGDDFITKNDRVMVFALPEAIKRVEKFFAS